METLPSEGPGTLVCSTRHLSIFGGVISVILKNVVVALECSTFSTLMDAAAFKKLGQPDWLARPPGVVSICIVVFSTLAVCIGVRGDHKALEQIPWAATERMLMRVKETPTPKEFAVAEVDGEDHEYETEEGMQETQDGKKNNSDKKDNAASGDWELPSIFRALRGLVEALLDMLSQATGGANFVDEIKEAVSNAETGTINRSIGMIQSHRTGACQTTINVVQTGIHQVRGQTLDSERELQFELPLEWPWTL